VVYPVAPNETLLVSSKATRFPACLSWSAAVAPVMPAPTTATSTSSSPSRAGNAGSACSSHSGVLRGSMS
jgi:hypothetical protein